MTCPGCRCPLTDPVERRLGCCRSCVGMTDAEYAEALADVCGQPDGPAALSGRPRHAADTEWLEGDDA